MSKVPTAAEIRATFLDFFKEKQHTIVPSDNVGYTSRDGALFKVGDRVRMRGIELERLTP